MMFPKSKSQKAPGNTAERIEVECRGKSTEGRRRRADGREQRVESSEKRRLRRNRKLYVEIVEFGEYGIRENREHSEAACNTREGGRWWRE
jgi:hypothetical protein